MNIKHRAFSRGHRFERFAGQPRAESVEIGVPERVLVPLQQGFRDGVAPAVSVGQSVSAGDIIGQDEDCVSSPVHSSVNGVVEDVTQIEHPDGSRDVVVIKSDGTDGWQALAGHSADWEKLPVEELESLLYRSGVTSLGRGGIPTRHRSAMISPEEVEDLIISGVDSEMYRISLPVLLNESTIPRFVAGLRLLRKIMPNARLHLALNRDREALLGQIHPLLSELDRVELYLVEPKYPQGYEEVLIASLLGREFPYGYAAANIGVVVADIQTVLHAYDAVVEGKPLIERTVALCGLGLQDRPHARVRVGTPLGDLVRGRSEEGREQRLILNSPLTGAELPDLAVPIDRTCSRIIALPEDRSRKFLAFARPGADEPSASRTFLSCLLPTEKKASTNIKGEGRPCVSCGFCQEACPVGIIPHLLSKYVSGGFIEEVLVDFKIFDCIDCNLCSYVCPCKVAVARRIREGKKRLLEDGLDNSRHVLPRFELKGLEEKRSGE